MKRTQRSPLRVRITEEQEAALQRIATEGDETVASVVRRIINELIRKRPAPRTATQVEKE